MRRIEILASACVAIALFSISQVASQTLTDWDQPLFESTKNSVRAQSNNIDDQHSAASQTRPIVYQPVAILGTHSGHPTANDRSMVNGNTRPATSQLQMYDDLQTAAGYHHQHHHHHAPHGKYYEYREVPHKKAWKFGYRRGNHKHTIERHEHGKGPHFNTKVKWHDKKGKGVHLWDYNHYDKKHGYHKHG